VSAGRRLSAAVVGLGQVGLLFDQDKKRRGVWTHFTAYERLSSRFDLIAACDPDTARRRLALRRRPTLRVYETLTALLRAEKLDVLSLCTPPAFHARQIHEAAPRVRGILCEKPLSAAMLDGKKALDACVRSKTVLAVNYYKRYESGFQQLRKAIQTGRLGKLQLLRGLYSGPFDAVGSHLVDLFRYMGGEWTVRHSWSTGSGQQDAWHANLRQTHTEGEIRWTGPREKLIFEIEAIGSKGRGHVWNNGSSLAISRFAPSQRYSGYEELQPQKLSKMPAMERFLPIFQELADRINRRGVLQSDGASALKTQQLMDQVRCR